MQQDQIREAYDVLDKEALIDLLVQVEENKEVTCEYFDYKAKGKKRGQADIRYNGILFKKCAVFQEEKDGVIKGSIQLPCQFYKDNSGNWVTVKLVEMDKDEFKILEPLALQAVMNWCKENPKKETEKSIAASVQSGVKMNEML